jgi:hypothetical protein
MEKHVLLDDVVNAQKPRPLITIASLECSEMRIPQEPVTAKGKRLSSCGPIDTHVSGRCTADGR